MVVVSRGERTRPGVRMTVSFEDCMQARRRILTDHTQGRMPDFEQCKRLRPFCELAYASLNVLKADEGYKKYDTNKHSCPKHSADKVITDQILSLETTARG